MDFGLVGFDNLVSPNSAINNVAFSLDNNKQKCYGSGFLKQERGAINEDDFRDFKVAKTASCNDPMLKIPLQRSNTSNLTEGHQQMLCFSSPNSLPYYSTAFSRNAGYGFTGVNSASMQAVLSGVRGPFTSSQWIELEQQALIYKYITANVPVPSYLLNPIRKAFESAGFSSFSGLRSNPLGWGAFHLGFSNTDPEPGRCRRTDGKKWRCSRDAVADQKYCERHMNRGRHRSRKPVEGQSGHSASATTTTNSNTKPPPASSSSASVVPAGGVSNSLGLSHHHQLSNVHHGSSNHLSGIPNINRSLLDKENTDGPYQHTSLHSITSPKVFLKNNNYSIPKQQNPYEGSSGPEFGLVCSDSLLNPLNRSSFLVNCRNYSTTSDNLKDHEHKSQNHALRQFMDDWPKNNSERSSISWPNIDLQPDRTQLSISIPMVTSDFMSSASSPTSEKLRASPLRLSGELEMGLGVGTVACQENLIQLNCVPISWEPSPGGPLGEVLHTTGDSKSNTKPLNLIDSWDNSPRLTSSPTGVLQRGAFGSLSNSSAGSSPRTDGVMGSSVMNHSSFPAL
ncbi:hypothetical protein CDL12_06210 [Handroanthus impetiginosus]|uniref:Growth-regulating factor n=1 Tax=Handroanthus impetiginosus TaxID=429701 RepID=A0A2G9HUB0_9LAMI|nr:hypothetical protein CDL12_06210 [Handroanthus impetiginosus]